MDSEQKAKELVMGERQKDYGAPKVNFGRISKIWSGILDIDVTPEQVAMCMMGLKLARLVHTPDHEDTQVDLIGYVRVLQRLLDPEDKPFVAAKDYVPVQAVLGNYGIRMVDPRGKVFYCETATAASILASQGWMQMDPSHPEPTAFTAPYPDGSKDMTFEEACGVSRAAAELDLPCEAGVPPSENDYYSALEGWKPVRSKHGSIMGYAKAKKEDNPCGQ